MAAEAEVKARLSASAELSALPGLVIFAGRAAQAQAAPFVVWSRISARRDGVLDGRSDVQFGRFQIDCFGRTYDEMVAMGGAVDRAMTGAQTTGLWAEKDSERDILETDEPRMWRRVMDFLTTERN